MVNNNKLECNVLDIEKVHVKQYLFIDFSHVLLLLQLKNSSVVFISVNKIILITNVFLLYFI